MGLDVNLYSYPDFDRTVRAEKEFEDRSEPLWGDEVSEEARDGGLLALAKEIGVSVGGEKDGKIRVNMPSAKYPDHLFQVGYFRSSYNGSGINHVLLLHGLQPLGEIFDVKSDEYRVRPDWAASRVRAVQALDGLRAVQADPSRSLAAAFQPAWAQGLPHPNVEEADAIRLTRDELAKPNPFGDSGFSNRNGAFIPAGIQVVGMVPGVRYSFDGPGVWVVYRVPTDTMDSYIQSLEIVIETIDYVMEHPLASPDEYVLHWSG